RKLLVVGRYHAAFAGGDHFVCVKTEAGHVAKAARHATTAGCAMRLGTIFDYQQVVLPCKFHQTVHVYRMSVEMHRYDCLRFLGYQMLDQIEVEVPCDCFRVNRNGRGLVMDRCECSGDVSA